MFGDEDGRWTTLLCLTATATFSSLVSGATRLAFDAISSRGMRGSEGPICMPGLAVVVLSLGLLVGVVLGRKVPSVVVGSEVGGQDTLVCDADAATELFSLLVTGAARLAFDATSTSRRGMGGSNEVCVDGPIEGVMFGITGPQLKMILSHGDPLHEKTYLLPRGAPAYYHSSTMQLSKGCMQV